jgi:hypothetical protein
MLEDRYCSANLISPLEGWSNSANSVIFSRIMASTGWYIWYPCPDQITVGYPTNLSLIVFNVSSNALLSSFGPSLPRSKSIKIKFGACLFIPFQPVKSGYALILQSKQYRGRI